MKEMPVRLAKTVAIEQIRREYECEEMTVSAKAAKTTETASIVITIDDMSEEEIQKMRNCSVALKRLTQAELAVHGIDQSLLHKCQQPSSSEGLRKRHANDALDENNTRQTPAPPPAKLMRMAEGQQPGTSKDLLANRPVHVDMNDNETNETMPEAAAAKLSKLTQKKANGKTVGSDENGLQLDGCGNNNDVPSSSVSSKLSSRSNIVVEKRIPLRGITNQSDRDASPANDASKESSKNSQTRIAEAKKNAGNEQYKAQNYEAALRLYSEAIALCPDSAAFHGNRSACNMMMGDYKAALSDCRQAIAFDDKFEKCYVRAAKCCLAMGDIEEIERIIQKWEKIEPNSNAVKSFEPQCIELCQVGKKALQCFDKKDYRTAVNHADSALEIAPESMKFKLLKAESLALLGRTEEANDLALSCTMSDSKNADAAYVRGLCLYYGNNWDLGLTHFQLAVILDPKHKNAETMRIKVENLIEKREKSNKLYKAGKFPEAYTMYTEALKIDRSNSATNSELSFNRALVSSKIGNFRDAIADCTNALSKNCSFLKAILLRAECHTGMENFGKAVKDYEVALKLNETAEIKNLLGEARANNLKKNGNKLYETGKFREAHTLYTEALQIVPLSSDTISKILFNRALVNSKVCDFRGAIADCTYALSQNSSFLNAILLRAECYNDMENFVEAAKDYEAALKLKETDEIRNLLGEAKAKYLKENGNELYKTGRLHEAYTLYTKALENVPLNSTTKSEISYNRALVNSKIGNNRDAIADCTNALKENSSYLKALLLRAKCYNDLEDFEEAVKDYEAAYELEATPEIWLLLNTAKIASKIPKRKDYYKILGIYRNASDDEIKKAYKMRAFEHHPDKHASKSDAEKREHEEKFKEVGEAYAILSDPQSKSQFDNGPIVTHCNPS